MKDNTKNTLLIFVYFVAGLISLNVLPSSLPTHILGICFIIAMCYCIVAVSKGKKLI